MNLQFRELAALYSFFYYDNVENQSKYPIKFAIFQEEVGKTHPPPPLPEPKCKIAGAGSMKVLGVYLEGSLVDYLSLPANAELLQVETNITRIPSEAVAKAIAGREIDWIRFNKREAIVDIFLKPPPREFINGSMRFRDAND